MDINGYGIALEKNIKDFEQHIGFSLPDDYKEFLRKYNGGTPKIRYSTFTVADLDEEIPLHVLYGLCVDKKLDLHTWHSEYEDDLGEYSIIIGHDHGSGIIVLVNEADVKEVYYWDHTFNFEQSSEEENTYKIADSFQDFIDGLKNP